MIEHLSGRLIEKTPTRAIVSAAGVGYGVLISLATYESLPDIGAQTSLHTYLVVREDALTLFGFATTTERSVFLMLTSVTGVGPKIALGILSGGGIDPVREHIARANAAALTRLPGVGRKLADRLVLELRDKIGTVEDSGDGGFTDNDHASIRDEALTALTVLGYNRASAEKAIRAALKSGPEAESSVESLIKLALRQLNS